MPSGVDRLAGRAAPPPNAKAEAAAVLAVEDVAKSYGRVKALDGVSLTVDRGEFVALLGPNGAGKTTLFQLLSGLFLPDRGALRIEGWDLRRHAVRALAGIGIVFQQPTLDLDMTVAANLRFHARLHGMTRRATAERIAAELDRLGLADQAGTACRKLSGGQRRRVELARALLHEPRLLLMDEPTVGLDPASRRDLVAHVRGLAAGRGIAVLWATHLVDEAETADRVVILHRGRVAAAGRPGDLARDDGALEAAYLRLTGPAGDGPPATPAKP
jgi:ABC-2 type transport system ATP-binding protein